MFHNVVDFQYNLWHLQVAIFQLKKKVFQMIRSFNQYRNYTTTLCKKLDKIIVICK